MIWRVALVLLVIAAVVCLGICVQTRAEWWAEIAALCLWLAALAQAIASGLLRRLITEFIASSEIANPATIVPNTPARTGLIHYFFNREGAGIILFLAAIVLFVVAKSLS